MTDGKFSSQSAASARRRALTLGARFGAGVAAGGLSVANAWANERLNFTQIEGTGHPVRIGAAQHEDWDVVVIGSGAAGLAAALEARRAGARVVILEKMGSIGGNSVISEGLVGVPGTPMQAALGIHDSPALFAEDLLAAATSIIRARYAYLPKRRSKRLSGHATSWGFAGGRTASSTK